MNSLGQIDGAENRLHLRNVEVFVLLEDQHFRMIVKSECLFRRLIVDHNWTERRIIREHGGEVIAKRTMELSRFGNAVTPNDVFILRTTNEFTVIQRRERV